MRLRIELQDAPLGVQTATPRFAWELQSSDARARGQRQTTYEVLVASSPERLAAGEGDLWATGTVSSTDPTLVYGGRALASHTQAFWKVRVRDEAGRLSRWSTDARFTMGLLAAADWGAQWITGGAGPALPLFRREFTVGGPVARALFSICGLGQYEVRINGTNASDAVMEPSWTHYAKTCHYATYDVTDALVRGPNAIGVLLGNGMYNVPANARYTKSPARSARRSSSHGSISNMPTARRVRWSATRLGRPSSTATGFAVTVALADVRPARVGVTVMSPGVRVDRTKTRLTPAAPDAGRS